MDVGQKRKRGEDSGLNELVKIFAEADNREEKRMALVLEMEAKTREREIEMEARMRERDDRREERWFLCLGPSCSKWLAMGHRLVHFPINLNNPHPITFHSLRLRPHTHFSLRVQPPSPQ